MSTASATRSSGSSANQSTRQLLDELDALMQRMLALPVQQLDDEPRPAEPPHSPTDAVAPPVSVVTVSQTVPADNQQPLAVEYLPPKMHDPFQHATEVIAGRVFVPHAPSPSPPVPHHKPAPASQAPPVPVAPPVRFEPRIELPPIRVQPAPVRPAINPLEPWTGSTSAAKTAALSDIPVAAPSPRPAAPVFPAPIPEKKLVTSEPAPAPPGLLLRPLVWVNRLFDRCTDPFGPLGRCLRSRFGRHMMGWAGLGLWCAAFILALARWLS